MGEKITCPNCGHEIDSRTKLQMINQETFSMISKEAAKMFPAGKGHVGTSLKRVAYIKERYKVNWIVLASELGVSVKEV